LTKKTTGVNCLKIGGKMMIYGIRQMKRASLYMVENNLFDKYDYSNSYLVTEENKKYIDDQIAIIKTIGINGYKLKNNHIDFYKKGEHPFSWQREEY